MKNIKLNEENYYLLNDKLNNLFTKLIKNDSIECIYVSFFELVLLSSNDFIAIDVVFNDEDYYKDIAENTVTYIEMYTSVICKKLYKNGFNISFNIHSSKRSAYNDKRSIYLENLYCSEIIYDKYGIYRKLQENNMDLSFENSINFEPKLKLNKL